MKKILSHIAVTTTLSFALIGCNANNSNANHQQNTANPASSDYVSGRLGVATNGYQKPGAAVTLDYRVPKTIAPGSAVMVELTAIPMSPVDSLVLSIGKSQNVELVSAPALRAQKMVAGERKTFTVEAMSWVEGQQYINIMAQTTQNGRTMSRAFAVPLRVGHGQVQLKNNGQVQTTPEGERVIVMPVE